MDECKGQPIAAADAEREDDSHMSDADQSAAAAAPSAAASVFLSRLLPARAEAAECDICNEPLESSEAAGCAAAVSRLPRLLPCGHSLCTGCIQKGLDAHGGLLKCPLKCADFDPPQRIDSAFMLPKNFKLIKVIEEQADRDAMAELAALPCQQCNPTQPRQPAKVHCKDCSVNYCKQHDGDAHAMELLASHKRVSMAAHAAELSSAATAKKDAAFAAAAAASRLTAKTEEQKVAQAARNAKKRQEQLPQELDAIEDVVEGTAEQLNAAADRLRSDFQKHRQVSSHISQMHNVMHGLREQQQASVTEATQQLVDRAAALAPLRQTAQQVQQAGDFDANLLFSQLQRDSQRVHAQLQQASADAGRSFDLNEARLLQSVLSLSHVARQSLILNSELAAKLAPFCKGLELKTQSELLYRGSRDGFKKDDFVRCCANKRSTLTLVKVAGTNFVFGAYTHCSWPSVSSTVADPTGKSFLFSLVNASGKVVRFSLQDKDRAIRLANSIAFGAAKIEGDKTTAYPNFILMFKGAADQKDANAANHSKDHNTPYQPEGGAVCDTTFLAGRQDFTAVEIEVFQL